MRVDVAGGGVGQSAPSAVACPGTRGLSDKDQLLLQEFGGLARPAQVVKAPAPGHLSLVGYVCCR